MSTDSADDRPERRPRQSGQRGDDRPRGGRRGESGAGRGRSGYRRDGERRDERRDDRKGRAGGFRRGSVRAGDDRDRPRGGGGPRRSDERGRRGDDRRSEGRRDERPRGPRRGDERGGSGGRRPYGQGGGRGRDERRDDGRQDRPPLRRLPVDDDVTGGELDKEVRQELMSLPKTLAEDVAKNLVMVARRLDEDPESAYGYAKIAVRLASRVPSVREAAGFAAYARREVRGGAGGVPGGAADDRVAASVARDGRLRARHGPAGEGAGDGR